MDAKTEKFVKDIAVAITTDDSVLLESINISIKEMTEARLLDIVFQVLQRELEFWTMYLETGRENYPEDVKRLWDTVAALSLLVEDIYPQLENEYEERFEKKQSQYPPRIALSSSEVDYICACEMGIETSPPTQTTINIVLEALAVSARARGALTRGVRGVFNERENLEELVSCLKAAITFFPN